MWMKGVWAKLSETQKQNILDVANIMRKLSNVEVKAIKELAEKMIDAKLLSLAPDAILENMDVTEKLMLIDELTLTEEQRLKEKEEAISFEQALKEAGLTVDDLQD